MTLIGVKSKYGSCNGNCTGLINLNKIKTLTCFLKKKFRVLYFYIILNFF